MKITFILLVSLLFGVISKLFLNFSIFSKSKLLTKKRLKMESFCFFFQIKSLKQNIFFLKACDITYEDVGELAHLAESLDFHKIRELFQWLDSLDSQKLADVKEKFKETVKCIKNLYEEAEKEGKVNSDSEVTIKAIKYAAEECVGADTLDRIRAFLSKGNSE